MSGSCVDVERMLRRQGNVKRQTQKLLTENENGN